METKKFFFSDFKTEQCFCSQKKLGWGWNYLKKINRESWKKNEVYRSFKSKRGFVSTDSCQKPGTMLFPCKPLLCDLSEWTYYFLTTSTSFQLWLESSIWFYYMQNNQEEKLKECKKKLLVLQISFGFVERRYLVTTNNNLRKLQRKKNRYCKMVVLSVLDKEWTYIRALNTDIHSAQLFICVKKNHLMLPEVINTCKVTSTCVKFKVKL